MINSDQYEESILIPQFIGRDIGGLYDWNVGTVPQYQLDGATRPIPLGRVVGGGSILNGMVWNRGNQDDYNAWQALGNGGWSWRDILPYFRKVNSLLCSSVNRLTFHHNSRKHILQSSTKA